MTVACVRTLIEIIGDTEWDHRRRLHDHMEQIGFVPASELRSAQNYIRDIIAAFEERGSDVREVVKAYQMKRGEAA